MQNLQAPKTEANNADLSPNKLKAMDIHPGSFPHSGISMWLVVIDSQSLAPTKGHDIPCNSANKISLEPIVQEEWYNLLADTGILVSTNLCKNWQREYGRTS
jgi:hypothetical protein